MVDPAIIVVPGAWHVALHYADLIKKLEWQGFSNVQCIRLASAVERPPVPDHATLAQDTELVRSEVERHAELGQPIIMVMHSYGGLPGSNALDGLLWSQRKEQGKTGGVVHVVYVAAFLLPVGISFFAPFDGQVPAWCDNNTEDGVMTMKEPRMSFYNDIKDDDEAERWLDMCVLWPTRIGREKITYAPFEHVGRGLDATYIVTVNDYRLPKEMQEEIAEILGEHRTMGYISTGHVPTVSQPAKVAGLVGEAWRKSKERLGDDLI